MHWIWASESADDDDALLDVSPSDLEQLDVELDTGTFVDVAVPRLEIVRDRKLRGELADYVVVSSVGSIFSTRLRQLLAAVGVDNIQYYPVVVVNPKDGSATHDYQLANIVGRVSCLDRRNSSIEEASEGEELVEGLAIDEARASGFDLFRLHENPEILLASTRVKDACERERITGVRFRKPSDYPFDEEVEERVEEEDALEGADAE